MLIFLLLYAEIKEYMQRTPNEDLLYYELENQQQNAPWLVLLHGAGGSTETWRLQREALAKHFNLLLVDLPGHGKTAKRPNPHPTYTFNNIAQRVWEVVDFLKLSTVHLVGTSLGSIICLEMRVQRPDQVVSVVLAGAVVKLNSKLRMIAAACPPLARLLGHKAFFKMGAYLILPRRNHKRSRDIFIQESVALSKKEFKKWMSLLGNLGDTLQALFHTPTIIPHLLVSGSQDHLFLSPAKAFTHFHESANIEIFPNCGHVVTIEKARKFNQVCIDYIKNLITVGPS